MTGSVSNNNELDRNDFRVPYSAQNRKTTRGHQHNKRRNNQIIL